MTVMIQVLSTGAAATVVPKTQIFSSNVHAAKNRIVQSAIILGWIKLAAVTLKLHRPTKIH